MENILQGKKLDNKIEICIKKGNFKDSKNVLIPNLAIDVKKFFTNYEVLTVSGKKIIYMGQRAVLLTFNIVTEFKAQLQMMSIHNNQFTNFVEKFKNRVELELI